MIFCTFSFQFRYNRAHFLNCVSVHCAFVDFEEHSSPSARRLARTNQEPVRQWRAGEAFQAKGNTLGPAPGEPARGGDDSAKVSGNSGRFFQQSVRPVKYVSE
jgi:hypothetical protein